MLLKAMAKKITLWAAAEIIGVTDRTMRRWRGRRERYPNKAESVEARWPPASAQAVALQRAKEVQDVQLLGRAQRFESVDHCVRLRRHATEQAAQEATVGGVGFNGLQ